MTAYTVDDDGGFAPGVYVEKDLWDLWDRPQVRGWLESVPRHQRRRRLEALGARWEASARWSLWREVCPDGAPELEAMLAQRPDPGPYSDAAITPPPGVARVAMEAGREVGLALAQGLPEGLRAPAAWRPWRKDRPWHPERQAWLRG